MPSYYVWAKIIEALADLGYDPNMLVHAPAAHATASAKLSTSRRLVRTLFRAFVLEAFISVSRCMAGCAWQVALGLPRSCTVSEPKRPPLTHV